MLDYCREEIRDIPLAALCAGDFDGLRRLSEGARREGGGPIEQSSCCKRSGARIPVEMSASVIGTGGDVYLLLIARSIERRLESGRQQLQASDTARHRDELQWERDYLRQEFRERLQFGEIVGDSPALMQVLSRIAAVSRTHANVLILGESGVGKELVARAIHERSERCDQPLVKVNCPSVPRELFESEFFGHRKGAFTGAYQDRIGRCELAHNGTLFLDEVGEIPLDLQSKLLQVLQDREFCRVGEDRTRRVDVRIIAATNRDLLKDVDERRFRKDLYYRLSVFPIEVPPLRERRADIPPLIDHFVRKAAIEFGQPAPTVRKDDVLRMQDYGWPGNIRELRNTVERAMILARGSEIRLRPETEVQDSKPSSAEYAVRAATRQNHCLKESEMRQLQRENIIAALNQANWQISGSGGAADLLGINPSTLAGRMKSLHIRRHS
jgi:transcriptional regulator with GAF, ATPase, and Fis domain